MLAVPKKVSDRFSQRLKNLQGIISSCRDRDINESDTVTLVMDILCDLLGYDKYSEITKEHQIRSTYCDLAIKIAGKISFLIECKAIGIALKDNHIQQALNYAANQGCEWVILTNAGTWKVYKTIFGQPISQELVMEIEMLSLNAKKDSDAELLYAISREGIDKASLAEYYANQQAKDRFCIATILTTEAVLKLVRKELKAMNPSVNIETEEILDVLKNQVLKREVVEGDKATEAQKRIQKMMKKREKEKAKVSGAPAGKPAKSGAGEDDLAVQESAEPVDERPQ